MSDVLKNLIRISSEASELQRIEDASNEALISEAEEIQKNPIVRMEEASDDDLAMYAEEMLLNPSEEKEIESRCTKFYVVDRGTEYDYVCTLEGGEPNNFHLIKRNFLPEEVIEEEEEIRSCSENDRRNFQYQEEPREGEVIFISLLEEEEEEEEAEEVEEASICYGGEMSFAIGEKVKIKMAGREARVIVYDDFINVDGKDFDVPSHICELVRREKHPLLCLIVATKVMAFVNNRGRNGQEVILSLSDFYYKLLLGLDYEDEEDRRVSIFIDSYVAPYLLSSLRWDMTRNIFPRALLSRKRRLNN